LLVLTQAFLGQFFCILYEVDFISDDVVSRQHQRPVDLEVELALAWVHQDRLQRNRKTADEPMLFLGHQDTFLRVLILLEVKERDIEDCAVVL